MSPSNPLAHMSDREKLALAGLNALAAPFAAAGYSLLGAAVMLGTASRLIQLSYQWHE